MILLCGYFDFSDVFIFLNINDFGNKIKFSYLFFLESQERNCFMQRVWGSKKIAIPHFSQATK